MALHNRNTELNRFRNTEHSSQNLLP